MALKKYLFTFLIAVVVISSYCLVCSADMSFDVSESLVKIRIDDLQKGQPDDDSGSAQDTKNRHHKHDAAPGVTVSFTVKLGHIGSFSGKTRKIVGPSKCENGARR